MLKTADHTATPVLYLVGERDPSPLLIVGLLTQWRTNSAFFDQTTQNPTSTGSDRQPLGVAYRKIDPTLRRDPVTLTSR